MTPDKTDRSVLVLGRSQLVIDDAVIGLRDLGYAAQATTDFADITGRYDVEHIDLVVFGGQVPASREAELKQEIDAINPYTPDDRSIRLTLAEPHDVKVTLWWTTSTVPPDPKSDSLVLLDDRLAAGDHTIPVPDHIPPKRAFATVQADQAIYNFSIATEQ